MLFCAYCGKSFTRKEHLERHIPSHTNVKPHRCGSCQLSFSRRDLLQRHHSTYHELRDPSQPLSTAVPTLAGRTPIACMNCASAKTGCDKTVPCSRCAEKNLPCAARFARRASKILRRIATTQDQINPPSVQYAGPGPLTTPTGQLTPDVLNSTASTITSDSLQCSPSLDSDGFYRSMRASVSTDSAMTDPLFEANNFVPFGGDFTGIEFQYTDYMPWNEYPLDPLMFNADPVSHDFSTLHFSDTRDTSSGSENDSGSSNSRNSFSHSRNTSVNSQPVNYNPGFVKDPALSSLHHATVAAETAWPLARCLPVIHSGVCPRTALLHLEHLEQSSGNEASWSSLKSVLRPSDCVLHLTERTRDKILVITQGILQKALSIHRGGSRDRRGSISVPSFGQAVDNFFILPSSDVLEVLLQNYMRSLALQANSIAGGVLDTNDLVLRGQTSTLLVLLMIAQGSSVAGTMETRGLAAGLTEICRISLFDMIERDVELCADPTILQCALLFTELGAWSGDKWHMDIAMGQRGMYLAMLKHSGALEPQLATFPGSSSFPAPELQWNAWLHLEGMNRLVYNWVMTDLDLSLLHDTAPVLQFSEIQARIPNIEKLWLARSILEWQEALIELHPTSLDCSIQQLPPSLAELFSDFIQNDIQDSASLSPLQLRLLLHPIQTMLQQNRQLLTCFSDILTPSRREARTITRSSTIARLEELQALLAKWYDLHLRFQIQEFQSTFMRITLIIYHLLSLNTVSSFHEIERLARKDAFDGTHWDLSIRHKRCIYNSNEAIFHGGQVLRIINSIPDEDRPVWWPIAIYRVTLILWIECLAKTDPSFPQQRSNGPVVAIDAMPADDAILSKWRWHTDGMPVLSRPDGGFTGIENPADVLQHFITYLVEGSASRMADGVKRKLISLMSAWHGQGDGGMGCC